MIRKLQQKDLGQVMRIWLDGNVEAHNFIPKEYWISNYSKVQGQLMQAEVFVYDNGQAIQGFAGMVDCYLAGIFVDKKCRSMGIGKLLLEYMKKMYPVFSLHVYEKNGRALKFYFREGLRIASTGVDEATGQTEYRMVWG